MPKKPWEDKGFATFYAGTQLYTNLELFIPDNYKTSNPDSFGSISDDEDTMLNEEYGDEDNPYRGHEMKKERLAQLEGFADKGKMSAVFALNGGIANEHTLLYKDETIAIFNEKAEDIKQALSEQLDKQTEPLGKRFYQDMLSIAEMGPEAFTRGNFEHPTFHQAYALLITLNNPKDGIARDRKLVGDDLCEAMYDFTHLITQEVLLEQERQKLADSGWDKQKEQNYLGKLYSTHQATIQSYSKLMNYQDDPERGTRQVFGNELNHLFGRGTEEQRHPFYMIGMYQGENKAIENGWGKDELAILGAIGMIENQLYKYEHDGKEPDNKYTYTAEEIADFKGKFSKLKSECWEKMVRNPAEKFEIAQKLEQFLENSGGTVFADRVMEIAKNAYGKTVQNSIRAVEASCERFTNPDMTFDADERERDAMEMAELRETNPVQYLKNLLDEAVQTGDYNKMIREYALISSTEGYPEEIDQQVKSFEKDVLFELPDKDIENFYASLRRTYMDTAVEFQRQTEHLAAAIREGKEPVDPEMEMFRKDYNTSKIIATQKLFDTPLGRLNTCLASVDTYLCGEIHGTFCQDVALEIEHEKRAANSLGLSKADYRNYWQQANQFSCELEDLGFTQNRKTFKIEKIPVDSRALKGLQGHTKQPATYQNSLNEIKAAAQEKLERLNALNTGSRSANFKRMLHALEDVAALDGSKTPSDIQETLSRMGDAAKAYKEKIDNQTFAGMGISGSRRLRLADELETLVNDKLKPLMEKSAMYMCPNEPVDRQIERAAANVDNFKQYVQEKEARRAAEAEQDKQMLSGKVKEAQQELEKAKAENGGNIPDIEIMRDPIATILTANLLYLRLEEGKPLKEGDLEQQTENMKTKSQNFSKMLELGNKEKLFKEATENDGSALIYGSYTKTKAMNDKNAMLAAGAKQQALLRESKKLEEPQNRMKKKN